MLNYLSTGTNLPLLYLWVIAHVGLFRSHCEERCSGSVGLSIIILIHIYLSWVIIRLYWRQTFDEYQSVNSCIFRLQVAVMFATCFICLSGLASFSALKMKRYVPPQRRLTLTRLDAVISKKIELLNFVFIGSSCLYINTIWFSCYMHTYSSLHRNHTRVGYSVFFYG
jgi:hypothetical protein